MSYLHAVMAMAALQTVASLAAWLRIMPRALHAVRDVCALPGPIYIGTANKGVSAMLRDRSYAFVNELNVGAPLLHAHVARRAMGSITSPP